MGGDHKCPLCSATFTRPQHVGRHLRAHTGDRPYECKECPLRFARSDLLSRHVNKAHRPPGEQPEKKDGRKGRRKSMSAQGQGASGSSSGNGSPTDRDGGSGGTGKNGAAKARASSFSQFGQQSGGLGGMMGMDGNGSVNGTGAFNGGLNGQPMAQTALPAHQLYPHHPLLANSPQQPTTSFATWPYGGAQPSVNGFTATATYAQAGLVPQNGGYGAAASNNTTVNASGPAQQIPGYGNVNLVATSPFTAAPMRMSGSEQGSSTSPNSMFNLNRSGPNGNYLGMSIDYGTKKRACDQCNHSKVRCDFNDPCARCMTKNLGCSYNKTPKSRSIVQPMPWAAGRLSMPGLSTPYSGNTSLSPTTQFSSPSSQANISPATGNAPLEPMARYGSASNTDRTPVQHQRSHSFGAASHMYAPMRPGMPVEAYSRTFPALQGWSGGLQQEAATNNVQSATQAGQGAFEYLPMTYGGDSGMFGPTFASPPNQGMPLQAQDAQTSTQAQLQNPTTYPYGISQPVFSASPSQGAKSVSPPIVAGTMPRPAPVVRSPPNNGAGPSRKSSLNQQSSVGMAVSNSASPGTHLTATPGLTPSHTISPSSSEEPARTSSFGSTGQTGGNSGRPEPAVHGRDPSPVVAEARHQTALALSPSSMQPLPMDMYNNLPIETYPSIGQGMGGMDIDWTVATAQAQAQALLQQQQQLQPGPSAVPPAELAFAPRNFDKSSRLSISTLADDDDLADGNTLSRTESLANSGVLNDQSAENTGAALDHRRRSSGVWAMAFNAMTLQDPTLAPLPIPSDMVSDPFSASNIAHQAQAQVAEALQLQAQGAPTVSQEPSLATVTEGTASTFAIDAAKNSEDPMPSMSDVKDLWKLFMNDPMFASGSGLMPMGEKGNGMDGSINFGNFLLTPRPGAGERTLSKSNSMPDLTSPLIGQAFFANYFKDAVTPRPGDGPGGPIGSTMGTDVSNDTGIPKAALEAMKSTSVRQGSAAEGGDAKTEIMQPSEIVEPANGAAADAAIASAQDPQVPVEAGPPTAGPTIEQQKAMNKWKNAISSQSNNFSFQLNPKLGGKGGLSALHAAMAPASVNTTALNLHIPQARQKDGKLSVNSTLAAMAGNSYGVNINMGASTNQHMPLYPGTTSTGMGGVRFDLSGRPTASVFQRNYATLNSMALNETLAPERAPSFSTPGLGPGGFALPFSMNTPTKGTYAAAAKPSGLGSGQTTYPPPPMFSFNNTNTVTGKQVSPQKVPPTTDKIKAEAAVIADMAAAAVPNPRTAQVQKGSSAMTRPGNKRLASQTLGGEGKKATFGFWDEEETDGE